MKCFHKMEVCTYFVLDVNHGAGGFLADTCRYMVFEIV